MRRIGCEEIYGDGDTTRGRRENLNNCLNRIQPGETLVVIGLHRLGCQVKEQALLLADLEEKGVWFRSLDEGIDSASDDGCGFGGNLKSLAGMEKELGREKSRLSQFAAVGRGGKRGRKRRMTKAKTAAAKTLFARGMAPTEIADYLGVSVPTLYRWCPASERMGNDESQSLVDKRQTLGSSLFNVRDDSKELLIIHGPELR